MSDASSDDVISWNDNGRTFTVWKPDVLESEYLPKTFKHSNFASFVRQLNNYGFRKCHSDRYEFGVEAFERNKPELLTKLKRHDAPRTKRSNPVKKGGKTDASLALQSAQESLELGAYGGLASEVEQLKRDRLLLLKEVMRLRETQHAQRDEVTRLTNRLEATENFQTQMRHFVQAVHDGENINAALRESGLAGFDADAALGPRKRRGAPRYLPTLEGSTGKQQTPTAGALPDTPGIVPPSPLSLEEIDDEALTALTPSRLNSLPWHEFLASPTNESLRSLVEDMSYEGELDAAKFDEGDEAFVSSLLDRSNSGLERQLSLSFLDSDEMTEMVKEMQIGKAASPERKPASKTSKAKGKTTTSPQKGKSGAK